MATAYSVTGTGPGSALKEGQKGAADMWLGVEKLIGPRIVFCDTTTMVGASMPILFPQPLPGVDSDYGVVTGMSANHSYASALTVNGFTLNGTDDDVVFYAVIKLNNATVVPAF